MKPLTKTMQKVVANLQAGRSFDHGFPGGRSMSGGLSGARWALVQRGLILPGSDTLTEAGRKLELKK